MTLDAALSLMFLAGFLAAAGLGLFVRASYQQVQIVRYVRAHPREFFAAAGASRFRRFLTRLMTGAGE